MKLRRERNDPWLKSVSFLAPCEVWIEKDLGIRVQITGSPCTIISMSKNGDIPSELEQEQILAQLFPDKEYIPYNHGSSLKYIIK